jgi:nitrite reductase/ring-hydroxylating ferredoxin subunit
MDFVVDLAEIPDGGAIKVEVSQNLWIALFRVKDRVAAVRNRCPHAGASLCDGAFDGFTVVCPAHDYRFNVWNGAGYTTLKTFATEVADGKVKIVVPD